MASINSVIEYVDSVKPNAFDEACKSGWIIRLEGMINTEVHGREAPCLGPESWDEPLSVPRPYDDIYALYVSAMIDFHNRETAAYNNSALMFTKRLEQYKSDHIRKNPWGGAGGFRNVLGG